ncbi:hypothetical protein GH714_005613 [Hevea brasiliensis]|uniref:Uncharacterized protein n=1 Tax=Hevea brasiliensis TaxID=3981 RepID=A0A6A6KXZ5_HEVBR|nr:hypothetical protein GH714_005613 [Hevea brasiliensis]
MKGYSKIKIIGSTSSRSMDLSCPLTSPIPKKPNNTELETKPQETSHQSFKNPKTTKTTTTTNIKNLQDSLTWLQAEDDEENNAEMFSSSKLKRNSSVSSACAFHSAVKKAFSTKRSSSVSERYCRIHDQYAALPSPTHHEEDDGSMETAARSVRRKNSGRRILRAWFH